MRLEFTVDGLGPSLGQAWGLAPDVGEELLEEWNERNTRSHGDTFRSVATHRANTNGRADLIAPDYPPLDYTY